MSLWGSSMLGSRDGERQEVGDLLPHTEPALNGGRAHFPVISNEEGRSQPEAWWGPCCWEPGSGGEEMGRALG